MTNRELRHLSRAALLELLIAQMEDNQKLREQLDSQQRRLDELELTAYEASLSVSTHTPRHVPAAAPEKPTEKKQTRSVASREPVKTPPPRMVTPKEPVKTPQPKPVTPKEPVKIPQPKPVTPKEPVKVPQPKPVTPKEPVKVQPPEPLETKEPVKTPPPKPVTPKEPVKVQPPKPPETKESPRTARSKGRDPLAEAMARFALNNQPVIVEQVPEDEVQVRPSAKKTEADENKSKAVSINFFDAAFASIERN